MQAINTAGRERNKLRDVIALRVASNLYLSRDLRELGVQLDAAERKFGKAMRAAYPNSPLARPITRGFLRVSKRRRPK